MNCLITGATGNVGRYVVSGLKDMHVYAGVSSGKSAERLPEHTDYRVLDFSDEKTWQNALKDIDALFLMRPPHISNIKRDMLPFLQAVKDSEVKHVVFLSLAGAEKNKVVPHHKIEKYILELGITYTFLRPTFFMQNLSTTHLQEINEKNEIIVPAGNGKTNFIDVRDIAATVCETLGKEEHYNQAYTITGKESYTYNEIAEIMSEELKRKIVYKNPSVIRFYKEMRKKGYQRKFILVMIGIYYTTKFGLADIRTNELQQIIKRKPIGFRQFVKDNLSLFQ